MNTKTYPRFIVHKDRVFERFKKLRNLGVQVSYSWKTNPAIGEILKAETACRFSVHNLKELNQVADYSRVWFFPHALPEEDFEKIVNKGVTHFVIDLGEDIDNLLNVVQNRNEKITILIRMKIKENTIMTGKHYVFGFDAARVNSYITDLHNHKNINKIGIHLHRKTQNFSEWNLNEEIAGIHKENWEKISIINIGGGIPGNYKNVDDRALNVVLEKIKKFTSECGKEVWVEPGRFIASYAVEIECKIVAKKDNVLFINFSLFQGALDTIIANVKLLVEGELQEGTYDQKYLIKGCTPDSTDILRYEVFLENPQIGDTIVFVNAGAYTYYTDFCGLDTIPIEII